MLKVGDKIGITACSNAQSIEAKKQIDTLEIVLRKLGLDPVLSPFIFAKEGMISGSAKEKAEVLMAFYKNPEIKMICDISGGDMANEVLSHFDFSMISECPKPFMGYSDLTTILNALYTKVGHKGYLYQIRNLIGTYEEEQVSWFKDSILNDGQSLLDVSYEFIQGEHMSGIVVGGNIRCLLKLAGTPYMPEFKDKLLFLEAMGGSTPQMVTYLNQLKQMGVFNKVNGILLGTFSTMEKEVDQPSIEELIKAIVQDITLPIAKTNQIGHGQDSKALIIGGDLKIKNNIKIL